MEFIKKHIHFIFIPILLIIFISGWVYMAKDKKLANSHIFVCDNANYYSDFDNWLKYEVGVNWLPSYVIIENGKVIGVFNGDIDLTQFKNELNSILSMSPGLDIELPDLSISDLNGNRQKISLFNYNRDIEILEVHWIDCPDCQHQDDNYTQDIYNYLGTNNIYRYYIKSEKDKVIDKYSGE